MNKRFHIGKEERDWIDLCGSCQPQHQIPIRKPRKPRNIEKAQIKQGGIQGSLFPSQEDSSASATNFSLHQSRSSYQAMLPMPTLARLTATPPHHRYRQRFPQALHGQRFSVALRVSQS